MGDKHLGDMTEPELRRLMNQVATAVKFNLPKGTLFCVLAFDQSGPGPGGITQYVANCDRGDMIKALRETADRFERNDVVPR
ncbi:MAG: hypothetical protein L6Q35_00515 [Phycisphaerales bacterium]|nr:hypothetical protein [Phycisphaerales bacterium]